VDGRQGRKPALLFGISSLSRAEVRAAIYSSPSQDANQIAELLHCSFAMLQLSLVFAKILYTYDLKMLETNLDWEARSRHWIMWWKPPIRVLAQNRPGVEVPTRSE
jgi:broad specificity phosphatase PhoE